MQNKLSVWAGGAALAVVAIFAAAYFLLVGPVRDSTSSTNEQRSQVEAQNQALRNQNATLRGQFEHIDQLRDQLALLQEQVPGSTDWNTFTAQVGDAANANGVVITNLTGGAATALVNASATPGTTPTTGSATGLAIPVTLAFQGSRDAVLGTISDLQRVDQRLFLIQTAEVSGLAPSTTAQPPVADGDVGVLINGYVFVQPSDTAVPDQVPPPPLNGNQFSPAS